MSLLKILSKLHNPSLLYPVHIFPYKDEEILEKLQSFTGEDLSIPNPLVIDKNPLYRLKDATCYECARGRRKRIFQLARERDIKKIVLGHTKNDMAETFLMNIVYSSNTDTIRPVQPFFDGIFDVIRPFYNVENKEIMRYSRTYHVPAVNYKCAGKKSNKREVIRNFIASLEDNYALERIYISALKVIEMSI